MSETEPLTELAFQAESGDAQAQYRMGVLFLLGERVQQDLGAAARWFRTSAGSGNSAAEDVARVLPDLPASPSAVRKSALSSRFLVPALTLLVVSFQSGYEYRRSMSLQPKAPSSQITASAPLNDVVDPVLHAQVAGANAFSMVPEAAAQDVTSRNASSGRHSKRRRHRSN